MIRKSDPELNMKTLTVWSEREADFAINILVKNGYAVWSRKLQNAELAPHLGYATIEYVHQDAILFRVNQESERSAEEKKYGLCLRRQLDWFSSNMEEILRQNDSKGGWKNRSIKSLIDSASERVASMRLLHEVCLRSPNDTDAHQRFIKKCVDAANYVMMAADNASYPVEQVSEEDEHLPIG